MRRQGIQGRNNNIGKGLEARESPMHVAKFKSSISLAQSLGSRSDAGWGWRGERQGLDPEALGLMSLPPLTDSTADSGQTADSVAEGELA